MWFLMSKKSLEQAMHKCMHIHLRGVCSNSRHPGPRRVWMGGSALQGLSPFPLGGICWDWIRLRIPKSMCWSNAPALFATWWV